MPSVPLMRARPSFSARVTGANPASARAWAAGRRRPPASRASPSPIRTSATWASGAKSPEQPSEPNSCTTGVTWALMSAAYAWAVDARTPDTPEHRLPRRDTIIARTTSTSTSAPTPAAWLRISERCRSRRCSGEMKVVANAPKPVDNP